MVGRKALCKVMIRSDKAPICGLTINDAAAYKGGSEFAHTIRETLSFSIAYEDCKCERNERRGLMPELGRYRQTPLGTI